MLLFLLFVEVLLQKGKLLWLQVRRSENIETIFTVSKLHDGSIGGVAHRRVVSDGYALHVLYDASL